MRRHPSPDTADPECPSPAPPSRPPAPRGAAEPPRPRPGRVSRLPRLPALPRPLQQPRKRAGPERQPNFTTWVDVLRLLPSGERARTRTHTNAHTCSRTRAHSHIHARARTPRLPLGVGRPPLGPRAPRGPARLAGATARPRPEVGSSRLRGHLPSPFHHPRPERGRRGGSPGCKPTVGSPWRRGGHPPFPLTPPSGG